MDPESCIRYMMKEAGVSGRQLSEMMGKSPAYISSVLARGGNVTAENLARIASALGFEVRVVGDCGEVKVTPRDGGKYADTD